MSKSKVIYRAMCSEHADRLVEIAVEHIKLVNMGFNLRHSVDAEIIDTRIQQLRNERDAILELYEEEDESLKEK